MSNLQTRVMYPLIRILSSQNLPGEDPKHDGSTTAKFEGVWGAGVCMQAREWHFAGKRGNRLSVPRSGEPFMSAHFRHATQERGPVQLWGTEGVLADPWKLGRTGELRAEPIQVEPAAGVALPGWRCSGGPTEDPTKTHG